MQVGDTVLYVGNGICTVENEMYKDFGSGNAKYYMLRSISNESNTFFIPADNEKAISKIRKAISKEEAEKIIDSMPHCETNWIENEEQRKELYREILNSGDCRRIVKMVREIYFHKEKIKDSKKRLHITDENALKSAESLLHDELAYALGIEKEQVTQYITERIG